MDKEMTEKQALSRLAAACSKAEHCTGELREKMRRWGLDEAARERIIDHLTARRYVDDARFARSFVSDKLRYNKWGRRKIEQALWMKQVSDDIARAALDEVADEEYLAVLRPLISSKWKTTKGATDYERSMKVIKYAMGRGFTIDLIRRCIDGVEELPDE